MNIVNFMILNMNNNNTQLISLKDSYYPILYIEGRMGEKLI